MDDLADGYWRCAVTTRRDALGALRAAETIEDGSTMSTCLSITLTLCTVAILAAVLWRLTP
jgi:hypothetical protein